MSDKKLYQLPALGLGASDLVYVSRADGSSDGSISFSGMASVLGGVLNGFFSPVGHTHAAGSITGLGDLALLNTVNNGDWSGTALSIANGGTGSTTAAAARTALGLAIGTDIQAYSANLAAVAGLTLIADRLPYANGAGTLALATFTAAGRALVDDADAAAQRTTLGLGTVATLSTVTEADQTLADNTTNNVSTSKHGYAPKAPNDATKYLDGTGAYSVPAGSGGSSTIVPPQGRLSLTSGVAVMTTDATAQGTVYYVPYTGKYLPIYSGSAWSMLSFGTGISLTLNSTDNLLTKLYDIFCYSNSGTATLGTGPAWSNTATITVTIATPAVVSWTSHGLVEGDPVVFTTTGALPTGITAGTTYFVSKSPGANSFNISTTVANAAAGTLVATSGSQSGTHTATNGTRIRGTGAGTTELEQKDGIWTNKNAITLRAGGSSLGSQAANTCTYLGTAYMTANGQTGMAFFPTPASGGANNILGLYNGYNRVPVRARCSNSSTSSWTYASTTWRSANGAVTMRISYVDGLAQTYVGAMRGVLAVQGASNYANCGIARNSTTAAPGAQAQQSAGNTETLISNEDFPPLLGFSYYQAMEAAALNTATFFDGESGTSRIYPGVALAAEF